MNEFHQFMGNEVLRKVLLGIQAMVSLALIVIVASQTTKNEGLSGTIGGPSTSNFKGKPGWEEMLALTTRRLGIAWFVTGILVGISFAQ